MKESRQKNMVFSYTTLKNLKKAQSFVKLLEHEGNSDAIKACLAVATDLSKKRNKFRPVNCCQRPGWFGENPI